MRLACELKADQQGGNFLNRLTVGGFRSQPISWVLPANGTENVYVPDSEELGSGPHPGASEDDIDRAASRAVCDV